MPEGTRHFMVCHAPWLLFQAWQAIKGVAVPQRVLSKVSIFGEGREQCELFAQELFARVDPSQVPTWLAGGTSTAPWPYGDGGRVAVGQADQEAGGPPTSISTEVDAVRMVV